MDKYDTLSSRIGASILDGMFLLFAFAAIFLGARNTNGWISHNTPTIFAVFSLGYFVSLHYYCGQTLGKKIANVKVVDKSETPINFGQSLIRNLPLLILVMFSISFSTASPTYGEPFEEFWTLQWAIWIFSLVDIGFFLVTSKNRALHDFIAGTIVVRTDL